MPYTDQSSLPFSGAVPISRHTSAEGARAAAPHAATQRYRYLLMLKAWGEAGCTDAEAALILGIQRSTVNARRAEVVGFRWVEAGGTRKGPSGVKNVAWVLTAEGRRAVDAMKESR